MQFGVKNTTNPPAPTVNTKDFNTIVLIGTAPTGAKNTLILCGSDKDDAQFGKCLTGFTIPRALDTIRRSGGGKVVVINVFDKDNHVTTMTNENATVTNQRAKTVSNPVGDVVVKNTPVSPVSGAAATAALTVTAGATAGDTLMLSVDGTDLFADPITLTGGSATATRAEIVTAINGYTGTSGYSATGGSGGAFTITAPVELGDTINTVVTDITITGATLAIGTNNAFTGGVTEVVEVVAVTYVKDTDYSIDEYGNIKFLIAIPDDTVIRNTYDKLNPADITAGVIIGSVSGSTRTGLKLVAMCKQTLKLVPKIMIVPTYNTNIDVQAEMLTIMAKYRIRAAFASTTGLTVAQALAARTPSGSLATFQTLNKRARLLFPKVKTYDPQSQSSTLDDFSAAWAGHLSMNAAIKGPHISISNTVMPAVTGAEIELLHDWEDESSAAETNQLRNAGIGCLFSEGGSRFWGAENASFQDNTAVDCNETVMYVSDIITDALTDYAVKLVDTNITQGSIDSAITAMNGYYISLMSAKWIGPDSKVSFKKDRNPDDDLRVGKVRFTRNTFYYVGMKLIELEENMEVQLPNFPV